MTTRPDVLLIYVLLTILIFIPTVVAILFGAVFSYWPALRLAELFVVWRRLVTMSYVMSIRSIK